MATQTVVTQSLSGYATAAKLFAGSQLSDTVTATAATVTERTNSKGDYVVVFSGTLIAAGTYLIKTFNAAGVVLSSQFVELVGTDTETAIATDSSGGSGGDAEQTTLLAVKAKTDLIGTAQANVALTAAAVLTPGSIVGFPTQLIIGDSYDDNTGTIDVTIMDDDDNLLTGIGDLDFVDADITFTAYRTGDPSTLHIIGTCTYAASVVSITLPASVTAIGKPEFTYEGRLKFTWTADDAQKTFKTSQFKFVENP